MRKTLMNRFVMASLAALGLAGGVAFASPGQTSDVTDSLRLPPGFRVSVFAQAPGARSVVAAPDIGAVFVSTRHGRIYAIPLSDDDGAYPAYPVLRGLKSPNGIAWKDGYLYVAEQHRLTRYAIPTLNAASAARPEVLAQLPDKDWHGNRYATFGADGALYVALGSPCNVCMPKGMEGSIVRFRAPDWSPEVVATGIRNSVGLDVQPGTGRIYFTDNGADNMGDNSPPGELNALSEGANYGFPWYGGGEDRTPQFRGSPLPEGLTPPVMRFQAHVADLGVDFYDGDMFPPDYKGDAFIAQHGSWNRSSKVGYRVMRVHFENGQAVSKQPFIEGWLHPDQSVTGRPVDLEDLPDGSLLVTDDYAGVVYRVTYQKP